MLLSSTARETALLCIYGPGRSALAPANYTVHLFDAHPDLGGTEIATTTDEGAGPVANGYAAAAIASDDFVADDIGVSQLASFGEPSAAWPASVTHFALKDTATGEWWNAHKLRNPLDVTAAGGGAVQINLTIYFADSITGA